MYRVRCSNLRTKLRYAAIQDVARIVFERFHIVKLCNDMPTRLRRALYREATEQRHKDVLKGTRWLLRKNPESIDRTRDEGKRLQEALKT